MQKKKLVIAIPASVVSDTPHLREKTAKIGLIGRAAAIFRANEIIIYLDDPRARQAADMNLIATLLKYMETPQYLRKQLFELRPELQCAGILPPLRTPHHPLDRKMKDLKLGEYREGVSLSETKEGMLIDIGVEQPALLLHTSMHTGRRVTVKVSEVGKQVKVELANAEEIPYFWGYTITAAQQTLGKVVRERGFDLKIGTSRYGMPLSTLIEAITGRWREATSVLVAFGSPMHGLNEIAKNEGLSIDDVMDFVVNTIPSQGTETVRTEEAIIASLAILNLNFHA